MSRARRFAHVGAAVAMATSLVGFVRISFQPGSPGFFWAGVDGDGSTPVTYVIQEDGSEDIADLSDAAAVRLAARAWQDLPASRIALVEQATADASRRDFDGNDIHLVMWDDDGSSGLFPPGSSIVALTPLEASLSTGQVIDGDIIFNGAHVFSTNLQGGTFDVQSVATHEFGHLIGFDHGGGPLTSLHSTIVAGTTTARSLTRDEETAAVHVYPLGGVQRGRIAGTVFAQGGGGLRYAQVVAIDAATGELAGADVTDASGNYSVEGLPAGAFDLYVEPLDGPFFTGDTIALQGETADTFTTAWYPSGPVTIGTGQQGTATWSVDPSATLTITDGFAGRLVAGSSTVVVLRGADLASVAVSRVTGSGVTATHQFVGGELRVTLTALSSAARGVRSVEVVDPLGRVALLTAGVEVQDPDPQVLAVSPATLDPLGGEVVTIDGAGFVAGSAVVIGGQLATSVTLVSPQQLRATSPPGPGTTTPVSVVVIRPDGREGRATASVEYRADPRPTSVDPAVAPTAGGTRHVIRGTGFAQGAVVQIDGNSASVLSVTPTAIEVLSPPNAAGPADVVVRIGGDEGFLGAGLVYVEGVPPVITSFSPTSGPTGGGTRVTISGRDFPAGAQVTFDGQPASGVSVSSSGDRIECTTPARPAGPAEVRVTDPSTGLASIAGETFSFTGPGPSVGGGGGGGGGCALAAQEPRGGSAPVLLFCMLVLVLGTVRRK